MEQGSEGTREGGSAAPHWSCPRGTRGGQVGHRMRDGPGGQLSPASLPRLELLVCKNPLMQGEAHRGRGPAIGRGPSHPLQGPEPPQLFSLVAFLIRVSLFPPDSGGMSLTLAAPSAAPSPHPPLLPGGHFGVLDLVPGLAQPQGQVVNLSEAQCPCV